ncbi:MAG: endonuclease/exonuclease/phosphatase family metal-dependent hydrolase [Cryomorphaceae bacterium]|jgi:endonuclease/exonuclease/phosphatase family metal-dependent hydrolase
MIYRLETALRRVRGLLNRNRFVVWMFGLSKSETMSHDRGLIILQIDGLSRAELLNAVNSGRMPFIQTLIHNNVYTLHSVYSGIPSSTPAVHGEFFYGVKGCVPGFRFKRPQDKRPVMMLESSLALDIQQSLVQQGEPLLRGGSAYSDMFDGGADEASFCASSLGWSQLIPTGDTVKMIIFALLNIVSVIRVALLTVLELFLSLIDLMRGIASGQSILKELQFVPVRIATAVLLRELVSIGVKLDAARGVPIIHANFLSFDEQSHRRGPSSRFAHWSLKGIDNAIARIWRSAIRSEHRDYDLWIHSDHGQEKVNSYPIEFGCTIHDAVNEVLLSYVVGPSDSSTRNSKEHLDDPDLQYAHLLGSKKLSGWLSRHFQESPTDTYTDFSIAAMGPLGFIYLEQTINDETRVSVAKDLVDKANVPMVLISMADSNELSQARVFTAQGVFNLPKDKDRVFGETHPFLDDVCTDMIALCYHQYSGDFILCGWANNKAALSFRVENGAHAGPGPNETHAFALLPSDVIISAQKTQQYLNFTTLRQAAMNVFGKGSLAEQTAQREVGDAESISDELEVQISKPHQRDFFRVMTYNVHSCTGMDGRISPRRIARIIAMYDPDAVALQELDANRGSSLHIDQALAIADELNMNLEFHPVKQIQQGQFGNAILSKHPMLLLDASPLSSNLGLRRPKIAPLDQARGVMEVEIDYCGKTFTMINTHLGLTPEERKQQVADLLSPPRFTENKQAMILCGDFNSTRKQRTHQSISKVMKDVEVQIEKKSIKKTFPAKYPALRLDHIFVANEVKVRDVIVPSNQLTKIASDHLPLIADIEFGPP